MRLCSSLSRLSLRISLVPALNDVAAVERARVPCPPSPASLLPASRAFIPEEYFSVDVSPASIKGQSDATFLPSSRFLSRRARVLSKDTWNYVFPRLLLPRALRRRRLLLPR